MTAIGPYSGSVTSIEPVACDPSPLVARKSMAVRPESAIDGCHGAAHEHRVPGVVGDAKARLKDMPSGVRAEPVADATLHQAERRVDVHEDVP